MASHSDSTKKMDFLGDFNTIGPAISIYRPNPSSVTDDKKQPALIVFCTFMGGSPKTISKYTAGYQKPFPNSSILLIQSNLTATLSTDKKQLARTKLACQTILDIKQTSTAPIILHAMSNGGTIAATRISAYFKITGQPNTIFSKVIIDCAPGKPHLEPAVQATVMQLPVKNPILKFFSTWATRIWFAVGMFWWVNILRNEDMVNRLRRRLNDSTRLDPKAARLYVYSKEDKLIMHEDVHDHAEDARNAGWEDVREEVFEKAPHCGLIIEDAERYWNSIRSLVMGS